MDLLLQNAVDSITVGVEDYKLGTRPRLVSAARNLYAGVLLLFKEHLRRLSPPGSNNALIMTRVTPQQVGGSVVFVGEGKNTIDFQGIEERYESLKIDVKQSLKQLKRLQTIRNDMEHFFSTETKDAVGAAMHNAMLVLIGFVKRHLKEEPRDLLGEPLWKELLAIDEVYKQELKESQDALKSAHWHSSTLEKAVLEEGSCDKCGSRLLKPLVSGGGDSHSPAQPAEALECLSCGTQLDIALYAAEWLQDLMGFQIYNAAKDGDREPLGECFECNANAYLVIEDVCAVCGFVKPYSDCESCGVPLTSDSDWSEGLCTFCANGFE